MIQNRDWANWQHIMAPEKKQNSFEKVVVPRPGHADLVGILKYNFNDIRNSIERSSARETAARVAAGSIARKFLEMFGIEVGSFVESIGGVFPEENFSEKLLSNQLPKNFTASDLSNLADKSDVRVLDQNQQIKIINRIKLAKKMGDTLGGTFYIVATGIPTGLGSFMHYDLKFDAEIAQSIMSINAVKGVSIGSGFEAAEKFGSESHDEIIKKGNKFERKTNRSGGIEGGITTGLPLIIRAAMKPISTLMTPIESVNLKTMKTVEGRRERSDFVAVPACAVVGESMLAWSLAKFFMLKFGGDSLEETQDNFKNYNRKLYKIISANFR
jgi:chorismate synthase